MHFSGGRGGDAADDVGEVGFGIKAPAAGAGGDGVEDGALLSGFSRAEEEEVLFANGAGTDFIFDQIVVDFDAAVVQIGCQAAPSLAGVVEGFAKPAFRKVPSAGLDFRAGAG